LKTNKPFKGGVFVLNKKVTIIKRKKKKEKRKERTRKEKTSSIKY